MNENHLQVRCENCRANKDEQGKTEWMMKGKVSEKSKDKQNLLVETN